MEKVDIIIQIEVGAQGARLLPFDKQKSLEAELEKATEEL